MHCEWQAHVTLANTAATDCIGTGPPSAIDVVHRLLVMGLCLAMLSEKVQDADLCDIAVPKARPRTVGSWQGATSVRRLRLVPSPHSHARTVVCMSLRECESGDV